MIVSPNSPQDDLQTDAEPEADAEQAPPEARLHIGCSGLPVPRPEYKRAFQAVELRNTFVQPPKPRTAAEWRAELGPDCTLALCAWQLVCGELAGNTWRGLSKAIEPALAGRYGAFRDTEEVAAAWQTASWRRPAPPIAD